ncbi:hypothetical protein TPS_03491 [Trichinella pseudospiralis]
MGTRRRQVSNAGNGRTEQATRRCAIFAVDEKIGLAYKTNFSCSAKGVLSRSLHNVQAAIAIERIIFVGQSVDHRLRPRRRFTNSKAPLPDKCITCSSRRLFASSVYSFCPTDPFTDLGSLAQEYKADPTVTILGSKIPFTSETIAVLSEKTGFQEKKTNSTTDIHLLSCYSALTCLHGQRPKRSIEIDCSPALDSDLRERAAEIGTRLKLVADQMDKDRGTIIQYWPADWSETRDAVSSQQWPLAVSLAKQSKKSSGSLRSENKCRPLSPAPHRPD